MGGTPITPIGPPSARSLLVTWANEQDAWVRQLVSEVIVTQKALIDTQVDAVYQTFLREKALVPGEPVKVSKLSDERSVHDASTGLALIRLHDLQNVNALTSGQALEFNSKLTVVFGENACGKTGYVRVLKKAAAVRTAESVLPDVSRPGLLKGPPAAKIAFRLGQDEQPEVMWKDEAGLAPFNRIDVFDSRATALHVDGDLNYVYTPGELSRFPLVQQGIEGVRSRLDESIRDLSRGGNPFLAQFDRQTRMYPLIDSLGAATDLSQLKSLGTVPDQERESIPTLKTEIDALQTTNPAAQLRLAETFKQHLEVLLRSISALGRFDSGLYMKAIDRLRRAQQEYERATQESFAGLPIPGVLQDEWRRFIQAGEDYVKSLEGREAYPAQGDECLYCRQQLSPEALGLLRKYRDYCNNAFRFELDGAEQQLETIRRPLRQNVDLADLERRLNEALENGGPFNETQATLLRNFLATAKAVKDCVESGKPVNWPDQVTTTENVLKCLREAQGHNSSLLKDLTDRRDKREEALRERQSRLLDTESSLKLQALIPEIEKIVEQAKWVDKAKIQQRKFQGLLRSLTDASKAASEQLLNRDFERRFAEECQQLRAPKVMLQFPGRQGQVTRKKAVATDHRPSDVLSEGEQKVIALADFLAEATLKPAAPVIFDDPINSLDYKRLAEVVNRIVLLSETRQVIVFTHNIWFASELLSKFEKRAQDCSYYDVTRDGDRIGIVSKGTHPRSDTVSNLKGRINSLVQAAEKSSGEAQAALIEKAYELIRNVCEVIVEQELLQGVTRRYQPNVMMTKLPSINFNRLDNAVSAIYPIYEDCCRYIGSHSQPMETLNVRPTLAGLKADWKKVLDARDVYLKKT